MILATKKNDAELMALVPSIKKNMNEWQIVNVKVVGSSTLTQDQVIKQLMSRYDHYEGLIYPLSEHKVVMLIRLGVVSNYALMKAEIEQKIPDHTCRVMIRKMSAAGLRQIQIDLQQRAEGVELEEDLFDLRNRRKENIIMVTDDDRFIRKTMGKTLGLYGQVFEAEDGAQTISTYIDKNPDIIFLDIHMPGKSGLEMIGELINIDPDAFIIILSADSMKENVLEALERGAAGFLTKPPSRAKVQEYMKQCITIK